MATIALIAEENSLYSMMAQSILNVSQNASHYRYPAPAISEFTHDSNNTVKNHGINSLDIYPNPAKEEIKVSFTLSEDVDHGSLKFYDMGGREVRNFEVQVSGNIYQIDISGLPNGIYIISLENKSGSKQSGKFIKR